MSHMPRKIGLIAWFADNPVAANLLMLALLLGGMLGLKHTRQEITPDFNLEGVEISVAYPGASPEEVEKGVVLPIEHALQSIQDIETVKASAGEGQATVTAELLDGADAGQVLQDVRSAVSRITSFPDEIEPPQTSLRKHSFYVISIGVAADLPALDLFELGERIRQQLLEMPGVSEVEVRGALDPEIHFDVSSETLRRYDLSLGTLAQELRNSARDVPGGRLQTAQGETLLRTNGRREQAREFAQIPVARSAEGVPLSLAQIADVQEGFEDSTQVMEFNGRPGLRLDVYQVARERPILLAGQVRQLVEQLNAELPDSIEISVQNDRSERFAERRDILLKNGAMGLVLVIVALGMFLNPRLAFWVAFSFPVVFLGSFGLLPYLDVSLNMISLFAFILTIGIVVDDAIIVGENIHTRVQQGMPVREAVQQGASEMTIPVLYAVGTNIIAFIPLLLVPGTVGQFMRDLPIVVTVVFTVSLVEALLILPSHLRSHARPGLERALRPFARVRRFHDGVVDSLDRLRDNGFRRLLVASIGHRYLTILLFTGFAALVAAWYVSGRIDLTWRPAVPGNRVDAELDMPVDASTQQTLAAVRKIDAAGLAAIDALGGKQYLQSRFIRVGSRNPTYGEASFILVPDAQRPFTQEQFTREWRKQLGDMPEAKSLFFEYLVGPGGNKSIQVNLSHSDTHVIETAARELARQLDALQGVVDVSDGIAEGKRQMAFRLTPEGRAAGLDETSLGRQLRNAFYGAEVQRVLRNGHEVKVMLRLPEAERSSIDSLYRLPLRTPDGGEIALTRAAAIEFGRAFTTISRENGRRIIQVSASIDKAHANSRQIRKQLEEHILPALKARYPALDYSFADSRRDREQTFDAIFSGLMWSALLVFALFAVLFRSYLQAAIVMLTIPFAIAGAIAGHVAMGHSLSSVSVYGMIALGGLVVNGSLVLTVRLNELEHLPFREALVQATLNRFRPILLTAMTTTLGLLPMLFETSTQALFLVPLAIALTFGTLTAFFVVLLLIPSLYAVAHDLGHRRRVDPPIAPAQAGPADSAGPGAASQHRDSMERP
jgi:multidrug efflux pump subunit AcrB